ncbi:type I polyketide synthase [Streptomyces buecherae]|uniref:SDR family NAD(P)-dependent oxidoreductase n=1 Tax=Streptomyces buecherae TaxID=2763006 RepID=A0A7H8NHS3_9ACTN|nr:type I polyketide synthase [Streptomyces buecherae]QKW53946.1 SDR family NAD(P)-dependent oxidoreductase [Streptomyces buecherae]
MVNEEKLVEYLKRVSKDLHETRLRLREVEERSQEPVAVVSMACRFPGGVASPEQLWELVTSRTDAIGEFPTDRGWDLDGLYHPDPDHPGTSYVTQGGFLYDADQFDPAFFGISPREALATGPQQRLLLETAWEAIERAGIDPVSLKGSQTGVYAGTATTGGTSQGEAPQQGSEGYAGNAPSLLSGRVSYTLGLEGPAVTVETACSSSLVALHLAAQALRQGECSLALAGGVTVMATPEVFTGFSRQRGLSPDGRCKAFAAGADGTGWGEGVGLVLLERLSDARRNGHRVLAVLRGSAINQDGASNGFAAPNGPSQQRVIRQALASARLSPSEVDAVEAHGTGTRLGDPIEADALLATYGQDRAEDQPLWLGSVKSNIGHTQGAAGVAGVIKMVMALQRQHLPASLHLAEPTPHVDWGSGGVRLLTDPVPWPAGARTRRAGVSSFGISGTNAHVILEEAPAPVDEAQSATQPPHHPTTQPAPAATHVLPWVVSGRSADALRGQAAALLARLTGAPRHSPAEIGWSLVTTRSTFEHRAVVVGQSEDELLDGLRALADGADHPHVIAPGTPAATTTGPGGVGPVLVFPGQGSQWVGMGAGLLESSPVFAARVAECERALAPYVDWSLAEVLRGGVDAADLGRVDVVQPVLWAVMVSLAAVWSDQGVTPAAVVGHSQGEIAAAVVAGALSLEDGAKVVALRSKALRRLAGGGAMASLAMRAEEVAAFLADLGEAAAGVSVAAVNGPGSVVVSGPPEQVRHAVAVREEAGGRARLIDVDYASHSPQVDEIADELHQALAGVRPSRAPVAFYSTVTAERIDTATLDTPYWVTNLRERVRFADTMGRLLADGHRVFIEASTHPVLTVGMQESFDEAGIQATAVPTLRREHGGLEQLAQSVALAFTAGADVDWARWFPSDPTPGVVDLPTYAFQRQRYWPAPSAAVGDVGAAGLQRVEHALLPAAVGLADGGLVLTGRVAAQAQPWLAEHVVGGTVIAPGAALVEWALRAADEVGCGGVEELTLQVPLALPAAGGVRAQVVVGAAAEDGRRTLRVYSRPDHDTDLGADAGWVCHAEGTLSPPTPHPDTPGPLDGTWPPAGAQAVDLTGFYERATAAGYGYGPAFQGLRAAWRHGSHVYAELELPEAAGDREGFGIHPALLDAALHPALLTEEPAAASEAEQVWLPFAWSGVALWAAEAGSVRVRVSCDQVATSGERSLQVTVADAVGAPVLTAEAVTMRPASTERLKTAGHGAAGLFAVEWTPLTGATSGSGAVAEAAGWAVLGADVWGLAEELPGSGRVFGGVDALLDAVGEDGEVPSVVLLGVATPDGEGAGLADAGLSATVGVLDVARDWLAQERLASSRLVVVTRGAVATEGTDVATPGAGVWGLVRSAESENPGRFLLLDLDAAAETPAGGLTAGVLAALAADESQVALRDERALVPRLVRAPATAPDSASDAPGQEGEAGALDPDGTVLIVGGTGMLGALVATHLVRTWQVRHLVLASRRGPEAPGAAELAERLGEFGAQVRVVAADVTNADEANELIAGIDPEHPLTGVVHAAGVLADGVVTSQTAEQVGRVWAAKAAVAAHLHTATAGLDLRMFLVFSSAAGVVGNAGQAGYAAANAFVDALVAHRRGLGLPGQSVAWGLWEQASEMTGHMGQAELARLRGMRPLTAERGLSLLDAARRSTRPLLVAVDLDVHGLAGATDLPPVLRGLAGRTRRRATDADASGAAGLTARLTGLDADGQRAEILDVVRGGVAAVLGFPSAAAVRPDSAFKELGFDSLTAVELRNRLSAVSGLRLPATLVFDYPTPRLLAAYVLSRWSGDAGTDAARTSARASVGVGADEPVAIVGMACRFPGGAGSPEGLWDLVASGRAVLGEFPTTRGWDVDGLFHADPDHSGTSYAREGAFLYDADQFDAGFFGVNPREALATDPQQRLLLEASWEALERAGIDPVSLRGSATGVYAGVMYHDYAAGLSRGGDPKLEGYAMLAGSGSVVSGRVAYTLGLEGPAVTVDTACSSSLVAMHLAAQALRSGECALALAGGVTVMATPDVFTGFSRQRGLAPDGRCKPFAAAADGTGWGEGVGVLLLERLSDARRQGHRVLALVRGSAVNQDGASNGMTAPNGPSQQRVIRQALANAGLSASEVDAVEGHGTGTRLGDPIEAQALIATYGQEREENDPLWLGSVKSNIGHTQAAAGVAGVIKMVQAMHHGVLPQSLHIDEPTPHVDWDAGAVRLLSEPVEWPRKDRPRRAGISSFGASGTNAHVILEQAAPEVGDTSEAPEVSAGSEAGGVVPWVLSGRGEEALRGQAVALADWVESRPGLSSGEVGWSLVRSRSLFERRAVVVGRDRESLHAGLLALGAGEAHPGVVTSDAAPGLDGDGPVLVFPGQGSQWVGMGAGLLESSPVFAARVAECERALSPYVDWSLAEVLRGGVDAADLGRVDVVQPVLWAVMVSLAAVWADQGVKPAAVVGHSQGEIAAAVVAGALTLEDGARVVALRSKALRRLAGGGAMASLALSQDKAEEFLAGLGESAAGVGIAAVNGPGSAVVSGPPGQVQHAISTLEESGGRARLIDVDYASHSAQVDEIADELHEVLAGISPTQGEVAFYSTVTAERIDTGTLDTAYWVTNLREQVRFADAVRRLLADGHRVFIEASTHPVLTVGLQESFDEAGIEAAAVPTLRREHGGLEQLAQSVAQAFTAGVSVDWTRWYPNDPPPHVVDLPTYAFQREPYWLVSQSSVGDVGAAGLQQVSHALLPAAVELADGGLLLTGRLSAGSGRAWLAEHVVAGSALLPGAALAEWALRAADEAGCAGVEELALQVPLELPSSGALRVQVVVGAPAADGSRDVRIHSRPEDEPGADATWVCHAEGVLSPPSDAADQPTGLLGAWPPAEAESVDVDGFYARAAAEGYGYGPAFQGLRAVWRQGEDVYAEVELPQAAGERGGYGIHPALLDAALHPALLIDQTDAEAAAPHSDTDTDTDSDVSGERRSGEGAAGSGARSTASRADRVWLPFAWNGVSLWATQAGSVRVRISPGPRGGDDERALRLTVADAVGAPVLTVDAVAMRAAAPDQLRAAGGRGVDGLFALDWAPLPRPVVSDADGSANGAGGWAVLGQDPFRLAGLELPGGASPESYAGVSALVEALDAGTAPPAVACVGVSPTVVGEGITAGEGLADAGRRAVEHVLDLVRSWLAEPRLAASRLVVVTRGAVAAGEGEDGTVELAGAGVWGLLRSAESENPDRFLLLDLDPDVAADAAHPGLVAGVRQAIGAAETQVAVRGGQLLVPRLVRGGTAVGGVVGPDGRSAWRLDTDGSGTLEGVAPVPCPEVMEPLAEGRIRIQVHAAGVNFRDVVVSLGMVPGQTGLGGEGAGTVVAVGPGVSGVSVGDRVMGVFDRAFGSITQTDARLVTPVPEGWTDQQAAAVPIAYLTAWYGLVELGRVQQGERVLIHAATGGVGTAAVQIARHLGAEVYATASPGKHPVLGESGIDQAHRANSRDLDFEATIREATGGRGVDVVLNSLSGPFVDASMRLLGEGGRFLEMGKTDIRDADHLATAYPGVSYQAYDLITHAGADRIGDMLDTLREMFRAGTLQPPSVRSWPLARARQALRHLSQAKHTGKLVLDVPGTVDADGTVLITGGTGTLGGHVAEHLARSWGIRHLVLVSRRGAEAPGTDALLARLADAGADARVVAADVTDGAAVADLIAGIDPAHPLTGVVHAAGVLDDAMVTSQSAERLAPVWAAKASAAAHLHAATKDLRLGMFVLFSSAAATLGSPGQANYAAANAFCDALAAHRRALGLPGVSIAWGLWADASGMTGHLDAAGLARMSRSGIKAMPNEHALRLLDAACRHGHAQLAAAHLDLRALGAQPADTLPAQLRALVSTATARRGAATDQAAATNWASQLATLPPEEQQRTLLNLVRGNAAAVLGHTDPNAVHSDAPFKDLGFDSLTAVELRNRLSAATGLRLPATFIFTYPTPAAIAEELREQLCPAAADPAAPLFEELERLEAAMARVDAGDDARGKLTKRLETLLWRLNDSGPDHDTPGAETADSTAVDAASDDELFALIDRELPS